MRNTLVLYLSIDDAIAEYLTISNAFTDWNRLRRPNMDMNIELTRLVVKGLKELPFVNRIQRQRYSHSRWENKLFIQNNNDDEPFDTLECILEAIGLAERVEKTECCFITGMPIQSNVQGRLVIPFLDHEPIEVSLCLQALARSSPHEACFVTGLDATRYVRTTNHIEVHAIPLHPSYHRLMTYCLHDETPQAKFRPDAWPVHFMKPVYWQHR